MSNRQGSGDQLEEAVGEQLSQREQELQQLAREVYEERLAAGVAREQARKDLPLSTYTEAYWKIDLHNLLHFLALRMDAHAQHEIRAYANVIGNDIVSRWCPITWEAFVDYRLETRALSRLDREIIRSLASGNQEQTLKLAESFGWLEKGDHGLKRNRERDECESKSRDLGFTIPW